METAVLLQKLQNSNCIKENTVANQKLPETIKMDEIFDYIRKKNRTYEIMLGTRKPQQIIGLAVTYDKIKERIPKIVDSATNTKYYYSDVNSSYQKMLYSGEHFLFCEKYNKLTTENINSDILKNITALQRISKCFCNH